MSFSDFLVSSGIRQPNTKCCVDLSKDSWITTSHYSQLRVTSTLSPRDPRSLLVNEIVEFIKYFKSFKLESFWHRKSKKIVLAVLMIERESNRGHYELFRGMNTEVSLPSGSSCAERAAISAAATKYPDLKRCEMKAIATIDPDDNLNPIDPCGVCDEWLKKVQEVNRDFCALTFINTSCSLFVEKCAMQYVTHSHSASPPKFLKNSWTCRLCQVSTQNPQRASCIACRASRFTFNPTTVVSLLNVLSPVVECTTCPSDPPTPSNKLKEGSVSAISEPTHQTFSTQQTKLRIERSELKGSKELIKSLMSVGALIVGDDGLVELSVLGEDLFSVCQKEIEQRKSQQKNVINGNKNQKNSSLIDTVYSTGVQISTPLHQKITGAAINVTTAVSPASSTAQPDKSRVDETPKMKKGNGRRSAAAVKSEVLTAETKPIDLVKHTEAPESRISGSKEENSGKSTKHELKNSENQQTLQKENDIIDKSISQPSVNVDPSSTPAAAPFAGQGSRRRAEKKRQMLEQQQLQDVTSSNADASKKTEAKTNEDSSKVQTSVEPQSQSTPAAVASPTSPSEPFSKLALRRQKKEREWTTAPLKESSNPPSPVKGVSVVSPDVSPVEISSSIVKNTQNKNKKNKNQQLIKENVINAMGNTTSNNKIPPPVIQKNETSVPQKDANKTTYKNSQDTNPSKLPKNSSRNPQSKPELPAKPSSVASDSNKKLQTPSTTKNNTAAAAAAATRHWGPIGTRHTVIAPPTTATVCVDESITVAELFMSMARGGTAAPHKVPHNSTGGASANPTVTLASSAHSNRYEEPLDLDGLRDYEHDDLMLDPDETLGGYTY
eukprot:GDKJ01019696.1.p1 GENE.GDKJ01019696.1~~GDKJ01019696.1.p1  ORF type:complete len:846 (+),score=192.80 GDKJ01019696.1:31-2538(+)